MCGGGGGGTTTTSTVTGDPVFNQGLLALYNEDAEQAKQYDNYFRYGVFYDPTEKLTGYYNADGEFVQASSVSSGASPSIGSAAEAEARDKEGFDVYSYLPGNASLTAPNGAELVTITRGDLNGYIMPESSMLPDIRNGFVKKPFVCMDFQRSKVFPDAPAIVELAKLSAEQERVLEIVRYLRLGKGFYAPPGVSEEKLRFLREVFSEIFYLEDFKTKLKAAFGAWDKPIKGDEAGPVLKRASGIAKEEIERIKESVMEYVPH